MIYLELHCVPANASSELNEILIARLAEAGYESFVDADNGFKAYIQKSLFNQQFVDILVLEGHKCSVCEMEDKNWNEEWERNFEPVLIGNACYIRAPFHPERMDVKYTINIEPKMSFGTGHHETTSLMVEAVLECQMQSKRVLDMGCGTGVLAILATKLGAKNILAIDIDEWAYRNTLENITLNQCNQIEVQLGDIDLLSGKKFDIILANINRNILLKQIPAYSQCLEKGGQLLLSGIYTEDQDIIEGQAMLHQFKLKQSKVKNRWMMLKFEKE